jgi:hypothetical protein
MEIRAPRPCEQEIVLRGTHSFAYFFAKSFAHSANEWDPSFLNREFLPVGWMFLCSSVYPVVTPFIEPF